MGGVIIFVTIMAFIANFLWLCVWSNIMHRELDLREEAIEESRKMQAKVDEIQHQTTGSMISNFIKNTVDGDE